MNKEDIKKMIENTGAYDDSREDTLRSMVSLFYSRKMLSTAVLVWAYFIIILVPAVFSGIQFFKTDQTKDQIMYAAIVVCCVQFIALIKVFAWQMIHRNSIKREIKRVEIRLAEINETLRGKAA